MDVNQLALLARQPSAAIAERASFMGVPKRLLALLLANVMFWQPIWAQADGIAVSGTTNTAVGQAGNGVPVINIAAPNGAGLSHNQYQQYNVDSKGVILNNATNAIQATQLGGNILGNSQLGGRAASTILNEVTGANASQLNGYTEVAGQAAHVIVANPYGVTCNGCGFINTPRVTLSTGKPVLDVNGKLDHFAVDGGSITLDGKGLDASTVDQFDLITRSAKINADIYAKQLNVITGANDVNADTLATTARAANAADKPQLAIDSSALGGMYANAIKLVGTEKGVGVRTAGNMAASAGDIQIDVNGHLNMAQTSAQKALNVNAQSVEMTGKAYAGSANVRTPGELVNQQSLAVRDRVDINAGKVTNRGTIASGIEADNSLNTTGDVSITAPVVTNTGSIESTRALTVNAAQAFDNQSVVQGGQVNLTSGRITNQGLAARIVGEQSLFVSTPAIVNIAGVIRFGSGQAANLQLDSLDNRDGLIQAVNGSLAITSGSLDNSNGQIDASSLDITADTVTNRSGLMSARVEDAQVTAHRTLDNTSGTVQAQKKLTVTGGDIVNQSGRLLAVTGNLDLNTLGLDNRSGSVLGAGVKVVASAAQIDNRSGRIVGDRVDLNAASLDNRNQGLLAAGAEGMALTFDPSANQVQLLNRSGQIQSDGDLQISGAWLDNSAGTLLGKSVLIDAPRLINDSKGAVVSNGSDITLKVREVLSNLTGIIDAGSHMVTLSGTADVSNQGGSIRGKQLDLQATTLRNGKQGELVAGSGGLTYTGTTLDNAGGTLLASGGNTRLELGDGTVNNVGGILQGDAVTINAGSLDNSSDGSKAGSVSSLVDSLTLNVGALTSNAGKLFAKTSLLFKGSTLSNTNGSQLSGDSINLTATNLINRGGLIESNTTLNLQGGSLDNTSGRLRALGNSNGANATGTLRALTADTSTFDFAGSLINQSGRIEVGSTNFALKANALNNRAGNIEHANTGLLTLDFNRVNGAGGSITALGNGDWDFGSVDGLGTVQLNNALTYTSDSLALLAGDRLASGSGLVLNLRNLDNGGELLSDGNLTLNLSGDLNNSGRLSAQNLLTIEANNVSQNGGRIGGGTDTRLKLNGTLDNLGFLTARQNLLINAAQIDNRGTLGAQGNVNLNAGNNISNSADSLLFSGGTMDLRTGTFSNLFGDVYSRGDLSAANLDGSAAQRFSNLSGTVESEGSITISAAAVENAKAEFELGQKIVGGRLNWQCGQHCGGNDSFKRGVITIDQTILETATKDSASARLVAGKDLIIQAGNVQNRYSLLAANGNLSITANDLLNQGASERTGQNNIQIGTPGRIDTGYWDQMEFIDVPAFNAAVAAGNFDLARFELLKARSSDSRFAEQSNSTLWSDSPQPKYAATLQAGGTVNLNVARTVQNGSLRANNTPEILTGTLGEDQTGIKVGGIDITINKQASDANAATVASVQPVQRIAADGSQQTVFTPVDYSGIPFAVVDPTAGATFQLPKGDYGLFIHNPDPTSNYLIETNPNLTNLSQFLGSDYILNRLNINPDGNWRRLGDGLYEQRLIRDAVLAQTGQRFLANGLTSDYDQYRYLMDNALASKNALDLSLGVALNAEQVSALTHDIVWMENRVVDGQKVLVPVLYLAQADSRNVRGNSLIQGRDLNLISGGDLINVGTLRASNNLNVKSGGSIYQGGLVDAGNNLQMIAQDSIRNTMAGAIRGGQVSLTAVKGDILNDRTAIQVRDGAGRRTITDTGSTITARENLAVSAGRDITNFGAMSAGGDIALKAGNDINLLAKTDSSEKHELFDGGHKSVITTDVKHLASTVTAGANIDVNAGRDINVLASQAEAGNNLRLVAAQDIKVSSAGDIHDIATKTKDGKKRIFEANDRTTQLASELTADNNVLIQAGRDTTLVASKITAGNEAYLYSGNNLSLLAAQDSTHTLYDMKEKGNWGAKKAQRDEVTKNTNVGTQITTGGNLTLASERDQLYQVAKLESGKDLTLQSGGAITFEGVKDLHDESHTKSKSDMAWTSAKGKGNTDETLRQSALIAKGSMAIQAVEGLKIDVKEIDQNTVSQSIDAMVKADPQLAWLKEAEKRGDVDWRQVKELHDSFKYSNSSLGQGAMLAIVIIVTIVTAGSGTAGAAGAAAGSAASTAATAAGYAAYASAVSSAANAAVVATLSSLASQTVVSTINNQGNLGAVLDDTFSSASLKNLAIAGATAGFTAGVIDPQLGGQTKPFNNVTKGFDLSKLEGMGGFAIHSGAQGLAAGSIKTAINGGSLSDNLVDGVVQQAGVTAAAIGFNYVGSFAQTQYLKAEAAGDSYTMALWAEGGGGRTALHAMMGGALSSATGGDFATGAVAAGASQAMASVLNKAFEENPEYRQAASQIVGLTAADLAGKDVEKAAWVSLMADQYNRQLHPDEIPLLKKQSESLAREANISPQEAEKRLAQALVYYTDMDWNGVLTRQGNTPDQLTIQHLGIALSSRAESFSPDTSSDIPSTTERRYTPAETSQLITEYRDTHAAEYADNLMNVVNFQGPYVGDFGYEYANFYRNNLGVPFDGRASLVEGATGAAQGAGTALSNAGRSAWELLSHPAQGSEQIANGLMSLSKHPVDSVMNSVEASQTKQAMASIYELQGNYAASAAIKAQSDVEFALNMLPANRASTLKELGSLGRQADDLSLSGLASGETNVVRPRADATGQASLPSYYREDSSANAAFNTSGGLPEGYRRVINTRTGNIEVLSPDGTLYFQTTDGGLTPKAGGNLAQLVKAEAEIVGAKGLSSVKHASGVELPKSQAQMIANFETAGYPSKPVVSPTSGNVVGTQYTLPDGSRVRVMQADGRSPQRASFENSNGGPIDPTTGKPPQPPKGLSKAERKQWIRERTHIEQVD